MAILRIRRKSASDSPSPAGPRAARRNMGFAYFCLLAYVAGVVAMVAAVLTLAERDLALGPDRSPSVVLPLLLLTVAGAGYFGLLTLFVLRSADRRTRIPSRREGVRRPRPQPSLTPYRERLSGYLERDVENTAAPSNRTMTFWMAEEPSGGRPPRTAQFFRFWLARLQKLLSGGR